MTVAPPATSRRRRSIRSVWVSVHRWAGLYLAIVLPIVGLTGAALAFLDPIERALNPDLYRMPARSAPMLDPFELRERAVARVPGSWANDVSLRRTPGHAFKQYLGWAPANPGLVTPMIIVWLDPYTGAEIARANDSGGYFPITRRNLMGFVYGVHWMLGIGFIGRMLLGLSALIWTVDCLVALYLTLPARWGRSRGSAASPFLRRWAPAWLIKPGASPFRLTFDLHRAGGLWAWVLLGVFAWSSVYFNLLEVYRPVMKAVAGWHDPMADLPSSTNPGAKPALSWPEAREQGAKLMALAARRKGFAVRREEALRFVPGAGAFIYVVASDRDLGDQGNTAIAFDGTTGTELALSVPTGAHAATSFTTWIAAIHKGAVGGFAMKVVVAAGGLIIVLLSVTGVWLWAAKRRFRRLGRASHRGDRGSDPVTAV